MYVFQGTLVLTDEILKHPVISYFSNCFRLFARCGLKNVPLKAFKCNHINIERTIILAEKRTSDLQSPCFSLLKLLQVGKCTYIALYIITFPLPFLSCPLDFLTDQVLVTN